MFCDNRLCGSADLIDLNFPAVNCRGCFCFFFFATQTQKSVKTDQNRQNAKNLLRLLLQLSFTMCVDQVRTDH